jgi:hypothetical protein
MGLGILGFCTCNYYGMDDGCVGVLIKYLGKYNMEWRAFGGEGADLG